MSCPPLVLLTIDAGDDSLIRRWAGEGLLPTINSIMHRGWFARTTGADLLNEHGIWLSLISGVSRGKHGYYSFRQLKPGSYDLQTVTPRDIKVEPFWRQLADTGKKVAIIDAPDAFPISNLEGFQLSNWATHHNWDP